MNFVPKAIAATLTILTTAVAVSNSIESLIAVQSHFQRQFQLSQEALLHRAEAAKENRNYAECIAHEGEVQPESNVHEQAQVLLTICEDTQAQIQLEQAKTLAAQGRLAEAIAHASQIHNSSSFAQAQQYIQTWSEQVLRNAQTHYWQPSNHLNDAVTIANAIPPASPVYATAQEQIQAWRSEWANNDRHWQTAQKALAASKWTAALEAAHQITQRPYWSQQTAGLIQAANEELAQQHYEDLWNTAQQLLVRGEPENAMQVAYGLPDHLPWAERKTQIIEKAQARLRRTEVCQQVSLGLLGCY